MLLLSGGLDERRQQQQQQSQREQKSYYLYSFNALDYEFFLSLSNIFFTHFLFVIIH
jgi:hypothetical protein